eukprot:tig00000939_g5492.t1
MTSVAELARPFVSRAVVEHIARRRLAAGSAAAADSHAQAGAPDAGREGGARAAEGEPSGGDGRPGVVSLLDISGFSALCERCAEDESMVEELCNTINRCFSTEMGIVEQHGGEVVCFLGDAIEARPAPRAGAGAAAAGAEAGRGGAGAVAGAGRGGRGGALAALAARAALCGLRVQAAFRRHSVGGMAASLRLRVAVAAGRFREYFAGTDGDGLPGVQEANGRPVPGRMVHVLTSPAIEEAGVALAGRRRRDQGGEVAVCASALRLLPPGRSCRRPRELLHAEPQVGGRLDEPLDALDAAARLRRRRRHRRLRRRPRRPRRRPAPLLRPGASPHAPEEAAEISLYVPYTVRGRMGTVKDWVSFPAFLSEFRVASVLFVKLGPARPHVAPPPQVALYRHEGSLHQVFQDDKGLLALTHTDDAARAVECALEIQTALKEHGVRTAIGVTTGVVLCTFVGSPLRCGYSVFGTVPNRAARLMAKSEWGCWWTRGRGTGAGVLPRAAGGGQPRARPEADWSTGHGRRGSEGIPSLTLGRAEEAARVVRLVQLAAEGPDPGASASSSSAPPPILLIDGPPGSGKSSLCELAAAAARKQRGTTVAAASALESHLRQALYPWRSIARALWPGGTDDMAPLLEPGEEDLLPHLAHALQLARRPSRAGGAALGLDSNPASPGGSQPGSLRGGGLGDTLGGFVASFRQPARVRSRGGSFDPIESAPRSPASAGSMAGAAAGAGEQAARQAGFREPQSRDPTSANPSWRRAALEPMGPDFVAVAVRGLLARLLLRRAARAPLLLILEGAPPRPAPRRRRRDAGPPPQTSTTPTPPRGPSSTPSPRCPPRARRPPRARGRAGPGPAQRLRRTRAPFARLALLATWRGGEAGPGGPGPAAAALLARPAAERLSLAELPDAAADALICAAIGAKRVPRVLRDFVREQASGLPYLVVELARRLVDDGSVAGDGSVLVARALRRMLPSDVARASLVARLDRLPADDLVTAKICSVAGVHFALAEVEAMHPRRAAAAARLDALCAAGVLSHDGRGGYAFHQPLMQECAYSLLPASERRLLHLVLARHHHALLEAHGQGEEDGEGSAVLAHHLLLSGEAELARPHLERCAAGAFDSYSNLEAARLYEDLLALSPRAPPLQRARWLRLRAEACARMDMHQEAIALCFEGLRLLGKPAPRSKLGQKLSAGWRLLVMRLRGMPRHNGPAPGSEEEGEGAVCAEKNRERILLLHAMTFSAFAEGRVELNSYCIMQQVAFAERAAGRPCEAAVICASRAVQMCGSMGWLEGIVEWAKVTQTMCDEVGTQRAWDALVRIVGSTLPKSMDFGESGRMLGLWAKQAARLRSKTRLMSCHLFRMFLVLRSSVSYAAPQGLAPYIAEVQAVLDAHAKEPELLDEFHLILGHAAVAVMRLLNDDAGLEDGLAAMEALLESGASPRLAPHFRLVVQGAYVLALLRVRGPAGVGRDGRSVGRAALDAISGMVGAPRHSMVFVADIAFFVISALAQIILFHAARAVAAGSRHPLALPASILVPHRAGPGASPAPEAPPLEPSEKEARQGLFTACRLLEFWSRGTEIVRPLRSYAAGVARTMRGDARGACRLFERAAGEARAAGQARDEALALQLRTLHEPDPTRRADLAAAAAAAAQAAGDLFLQRDALRLRAAAAAEAAADVDAGPGPPPPPAPRRPPLILPPRPGPGPRGARPPRHFLATPFLLLSALGPCFPYTPSKF